MSSDCRAWCGVKEAVAVICDICNETCWDCCSGCDGYGDACLSVRCWSCRQASGEYCRSCMAHVCSARHSHCVCEGCESRTCSICFDFCNRCGSSRCNLCVISCYHCEQLYCIQSVYKCFPTHRASCRCKSCRESFGRCADCCVKTCGCNRGLIDSASSVETCKPCADKRWKEQMFVSLKTLIDQNKLHEVREKLRTYDNTDTYDYSQVLSHLIKHSVVYNVPVAYDILVTLLRRGPISKAAYFEVFAVYGNCEDRLVDTYWQFLVLVLFAVTTHPDLLAFEALELSLKETLRDSKGLEKAKRRHYEHIVRILSKICGGGGASLQCRSMCTIFLNSLSVKELPEPLFSVNGIDFSPIFDYSAQRFIPPIVAYYSARTYFCYLLRSSRYQEAAGWLKVNPAIQEWECVLLWTLNAIVLERIQSKSTRHSLPLLRQLLQRRYSCDTYERCLRLLSKYYFSASMKAYFMLILLFEAPCCSLKQLCLRSIWSGQLAAPRPSKSLYQLEGYNFSCVFDTFRY